MNRDLRRFIRGLPWPYALCFAFIACAHYPPPDDAGTARETCAAACARRDAAGCLEPALRAQCVPTCERIRAVGLYAPERCTR